MSLSTLSEPDCSGMCRLGHDIRVSAMARMTSSVKAAGCGLVKRTRSSPSICPTPGAACRRRAVAELDAVGVDVLAQERHLDDTLRHERLDLGEDLSGAAVLLLATQARHDAERARVVAADRDGHPGAVGGVASRRQRGGKTSRLSRISTSARLLWRPGRAGPGREPMLWVPKTTSTHGARWTMRRGPSAPCSPRRRSACRGSAASQGAAGRGCRTACCRRSRAPRTC